jgi:hypothetical protein
VFVAGSSVEDSSGGLSRTGSSLLALKGGEAASEESNQPLILRPISHTRGFGGAESAPEFSADPPHRITSGLARDSAQFTRGRRAIHTSFTPGPDAAGRVEVSGLSGMLIETRPQVERGFGQFCWPCRPNPYRATIRTS